MKILLLTIGLCFLINSDAKHITPTSTPIKSKIFAIIVGNTTDIALKSGVQNDLKLVDYELKKIANYTGLELVKTTIKGSDFNKKTIEQTVKNIKCGYGDVVLFYYTGHGIKSKSEFPSLKLKDGVLKHSDLYDMLHQKEAGLTLILTDCCNHISKNAYAKAGADEGDIVWKKNNYNTLFRSTKGTVVITSSRAGKPSYQAKNGSYFTKNFFKCLNLEAGKSQAISWKLILDKSKKGTQQEVEEEKEYEQIPYGKSNVYCLNGKKYQDN